MPSRRQGPAEKGSGDACMPWSSAAAARSRASRGTAGGGGGSVRAGRSRKRVVGRPAPEGGGGRGGRRGWFCQGVPFEKAGRGQAGLEGRVGGDAAEERQVGRYAVDPVIRKSAPETPDGGGPVRRVNDELGEHG